MFISFNFLNLKVLIFYSLVDYSQFESLCSELKQQIEKLNGENPHLHKKLKIMMEIFEKQHKRHTELHKDSEKLELLNDMHVDTNVNLMATKIGVE